MHRSLLVLALTTGLLGGPVAARAGDSPLAAGVDLGTPGVGAELQLQLSNGLTLRGDADWLSFSHNTTPSNIHYSGRLKSTTVGAFVDWHPLGSPLLVTGGAYFGPRRLTLTATPTSNVSIGGANLTPAQLGTLSGDAKFSGVEPFVGLGWDNTFTGRSWGFRALAGVAYSASPKVTLTSTGGTLSSNPALAPTLLNEQNAIQQSVRNWRYFPVLQIGVTHRF